MDAALQYTSNGLVVRVVPDDAYWANTAIKENTTGEQVAASFTFTSKNEATEEDPDKAKKVFMEKLDSSSEAYSSSIYGDTVNLDEETDKVQIGVWIYAEGDTSAVAAQVVNMAAEVDEETNQETGRIILTLDREYEGSSHVGTAYTYVPYSETSVAEVNDENYLNNPDGDVVYYFYAVGAGKYYNRLCIRGTRNTDLEKYYLDENDEPLYKNVFV